jgi:hypothetical protein
MNATNEGQLFLIVSGTGINRLIWVVEHVKNALPEKITEIDMRQRLRIER